jgi:hypothetical protein
MLRELIAGVLVLALSSLYALGVFVALVLTAVVLVKNWLFRALELDTVKSAAARWLLALLLLVSAASLAVGAAGAVKTVAEAAAWTNKK